LKYIFETGLFSMWGGGLSLQILERRNITKFSEGSPILGFFEFSDDHVGLAECFDPEIFGASRLPRLIDAAF